MKRTCKNCKHHETPLSEYPCNMCDTQWARWEPIAKTKEDDMGDKTFTMTFTADKINEETLKTITGETEGQDELQVKLQELEEKVQEQERLIRELERMNTQKDGEIRGLKFALRCNGVSGGEV